jgi:ribose transport system ATP-binding protein
MADTAIRLEEICKSFGGSVALDHVSLGIEPGVVRALLGQNGSGKSTIVKILTGIYTADAGRLWLWDHYEPMPIKALSAKGLAVIHQDLGLVRNQTALENFCIGSREWSSYLRPVRWKQEHQRFAEYCTRLGFAGLANKADRTVLELAPGERTVVAVLRALRQLDDVPSRTDVAVGTADGTRPRALILDEPTVFFGDHERRLLGDLLAALTGTGVGILMISHDFHDVFEFAEEVSILRDGHLVYETEVRSATEEELVHEIVGSEVHRAVRGAGRQGEDEVAIEFHGVQSDQLEDFTLSVHKGEIVGVTGLAGMGHEEIPYVAAGTRRISGGRVRVSTASGLTDVGSARGAVGLVPSDRTGNGVWLDGTVRENLSIGRVGEFTRWGLVRRRDERAAAEELIDRYRVVVGGIESQVWTLSGGNQQKVLVARVLADDTAVLVLDEPIQGVDIGAGQQIVELVLDAARRGLGVIISSIDYDLLTNVCDRVAILRDGTIREVLEGQQIDVEVIVASSQAT